MLPEPNCSEPELGIPDGASANGARIQPARVEQTLGELRAELRTGYGFICRVWPVFISKVLSAGSGLVGGKPVSAKDEGAGMEGSNSHHHSRADAIVHHAFQPRNLRLFTTD